MREWCFEAREELVLLGAEPLAAQTVDRLVAGDPRDPRPGVVRNALPRPALERDDEGFLNRLLGEVEVAEDADQRRDRPPRLAPEQAVDDARSIGGCRSAAYDAASAFDSAGSKPNSV